MSEGRHIASKSVSKNDAMAKCALKPGSDGPTEPSKLSKQMLMCYLFDKVIKNNIKNDEQLCQQDLQEKGNGNNKLANFVLWKNRKQLKSVLSTAWIMQSACLVLSRKSKTRNQTCEGCEGSWYIQAKKKIKLNQINVDEFITAVKKPP